METVRPAILPILPDFAVSRTSFGSVSRCDGVAARCQAVPVLLSSFTKDAAVMVTTELGACEWFVWDLRRSNLIDRGRLDQVISEFLSKNPRAEPAALAEYLVSKSILTDFQAERLLQGKTQGF